MIIPEHKHKKRKALVGYPDIERLAALLDVTYNGGPLRVWAKGKLVCQTCGRMHQQFFYIRHKPDCHYARALKSAQYLTELLGVYKQAKQDIARLSNKKRLSTPDNGKPGEKS